MQKLLSNTWAVVTILGIVIASLTVLAATHVIPAADVVKVLSGFLAGAAAAWQRGVVVPAKEEVKDEAPPKVPPVLPILMLSVLPFLSGCAAFKQDANVVFPSIRAIAEAWCAQYETKAGLSESDAKALCATEKVIAPWIQAVLAGQKNGVTRSGALQCEAAK